MICPWKLHIFICTIYIYHIYIHTYISISPYPCCISIISPWYTFMSLCPLSLGDLFQQVRWSQRVLFLTSVTSFLLLWQFACFALLLQADQPGGHGERVSININVMTYAVHDQMYVFIISYIYIICIDTLYIYNMYCICIKKRHFWCLIKRQKRHLRKYYI